MAATAQNAGHYLIEERLPVVKIQNGINTQLPVNVNNAGGVTVTGPLTVTGATTLNGSVVGGTANVVDVTTATTTLTAAQSGSVVLLDRAAGTTVTLPAPSAGLNYTFVVKTTVTSGADKVITDATTTFIQGYLVVPVAAGTSTYFYGDGSTIRSINLNGSTTGGLLGGSFSLVCIDGTQWQVQGAVEGSGTVATPFATS